jgi:hypothetical protein
LAHTFGVFVARKKPVFTHRAMASEHPLASAKPFAMPMCVARVSHPHGQRRRDDGRTGCE